MIIYTVYTCKQCSSYDLNEKQLNKPMILLKDDTLYKKMIFTGLFDYAKTLQTW